MHDRELERSLSDAVYDVKWDHDFPRLISLLFMIVDDFRAQKEKGYSFALNVDEEGIVLWRAA